MSRVFADDNPLSFEDIDSFFREKGAEKPCPDCGQTRWRIPAGEATGLAVLRPAFLATLSNPDGTFLPIYPAFCGNCGHVKAYAAEVVRAWRDRRG